MAVLYALKQGDEHWAALGHKKFLEEYAAEHKQSVGTLTLPVKQ
jgi:hypothetical protein